MMPGFARRAGIVCFFFALDALRTTSEMLWRARVLT
jgi:hypothetical protein